MLASLIGFFFRLGEEHISGNILFTNTSLYKHRGTGMQLLVCFLDTLVYTTANRHTLSLASTS